MPAVDFFGGKYQQSEQILPGPVQTFRAHESSTGRSVFVHRVSTTDQAAEQISLLRLLSLALLRSATTRNLVLDVSEEGGFWYVVTQSEPQCLLLREWLQFEIDHAAPPHVDGSIKQESVPPQTPKVETPVRAETVKSEPIQAAPAKIEAPKPETPQQPGEFTRFFKGGLPQPARPQQPEAARSRDRPSNPDMPRVQDRPTRISGFVQRPNTPLPPLPQRSSDSGEFTKLFLRSTNEAAGAGSKPQPPAAAPSGTVFPGSGGFSGTTDYGAGNPRLGNVPDAGGRKPDFPDMFSPTPEMPTPAPSPSPEPGEYTKIFGKGNAPPPVQQPSAVANPKTLIFDNPLPKATPSAAPPSPVKGPSEYTRVMRGNPTPEASAAGAVQTGGGPPAAGIPGMPPVNVNIPKPNPPSPPPIQAPPLQVKAPPPLSVAPPPVGAAGSNKKLIVLFCILGALAILAVVVAIVLLKK